MFSNLYIQQRLENHQSNGFETSSEMQELRSKLERMRMDFSEEKRQLEDKLIMAEKDKVQLEKQLVNRKSWEGVIYLGKVFWSSTL